MEDQLKCVQKSIEENRKLNQMNIIEISPGITLSFLSLKESYLHIHHDALDHIIEINYCKDGRIGWNMGNGNSIHLGHGDFSIHTMKSCADSEITLPNDHYEGLKICINLNEFPENLPELLAEANLNGDMIYNKFCEDGNFSTFAGNEETEMIFSHFYNEPAHLQKTYYKLKFIELILYLVKLEKTSTKQLSEYKSEQIEIVREIHEQMLKNIDKRFTIDALSKKYLMNPTTLKALFKGVYGNSIASHMKEHRMEKAAELLLSTNLTLLQIAKSVGYENQSKFTAAFKDYYDILPSEYRKRHYSFD